MKKSPSIPCLKQAARESVKNLQEQTNKMEWMDEFSLYSYTVKCEMANGHFLSDNHCSKIRNGATNKWHVALADNI